MINVSVNQIFKATVKNDVIVVTETSESKTKQRLKLSVNSLNFKQVILENFESQYRQFVHEVLLCIFQPIKSRMHGTEQRIQLFKSFLILEKLCQLRT